MDVHWSASDGGIDVSQAQQNLAKLERREWWSWATALLVIVVLTAAVVVLAVSSMAQHVLSAPERDMVVRGLVPLVVLFALFSVHQQKLIRKLRRELSVQMGMLATMEVLRAPSPAQQKGWENRRQCARYYLDQRVKVHAGKEIIHGRTRDISWGGIGVVIPNSVTVGSRVMLEFGTGDGNMVTTEGILRHHRGFYNGFEFVELSEQAQRTIHDVCEGITVPDLREKT